MNVLLGGSAGFRKLSQYIYIFLIIGFLFKLLAFIESDISSFSYKKSIHCLYIVDHASSSRKYSDIYSNMI